MKKDITHVVITFGLIGLMLYGGSFFYTKKILAEEEAWNIEATRDADVLAEQARIQEEIAARQAEEVRLLAEQATITALEENKESIVIETVPAPVAPKPTPNSTFANDIAKKQAEYQAAQQAILDAKQAELKQKQIEAEALAQQIADQKAADAEAQKIADAKAAAKKASRRSHAS
jgi:hypothetical protein